MSAVRNPLHTNCPWLVGMGFFTSDADFDPSRQWPGTTWTQIKDMFILAAGDIYQLNATGGEATHKLTIAEMPNHNHSYASYQDGYPNSVIDVDKFITPVGRKPYDNYAYNGTRCSYSGGDQPHNNMPPYVTRIYWERVG